MQYWRECQFRLVPRDEWSLLVIAGDDGESVGCWLFQRRRKIICQSSGAALIAMPHWHYTSSDIAIAFWLLWAWLTLRWLGKTVRYRVILKYWRWRRQLISISEKFYIFSNGYLQQYFIRRIKSLALDKAQYRHVKFTWIPSQILAVGWASFLAPKYFIAKHQAHISKIFKT